MGSEWWGGQRHRHRKTNSQRKHVHASGVARRGRRHDSIRVIGWLSVHNAAGKSGTMMMEEFVLGLTTWSLLIIFGSIDTGDCRSGCHIAGCQHVLWGHEGKESSLTNLAKRLTIDWGEREQCEHAHGTIHRSYDQCIMLQMFLSQNMVWPCLNF